MFPFPTRSWYSIFTTLFSSKALGSGSPYKHTANWLTVLSPAKGDETAVRPLRRWAAGILELGEFLVLLSFRKSGVITKSHFLKLITQKYNWVGRRMKQAKFSSVISFLSLVPPIFLLPSPPAFFPTFRKESVESILLCGYVSLFTSHRDMCISVNVSVFVQKSESVLECIGKLGGRWEGNFLVPSGSP